MDRNNGLSPFFHRSRELWDNVAQMMNVRVMINYPRSEYVIFGGDGKRSHAIFCSPEGAFILAPPEQPHNDF